MPFRRHVRAKYPACGIYGCEARATHECGVCRRVLCEGCIHGHALNHAKQSMRRAEG